jgi:microcystin-dependent protein
LSEPFLAEVRIVGFNFAPRGWAFCDGQILPINQNQSLYSLLGTTYGGDGRTSFALPDMRGRTPIHVGSGHKQGQKSGEETHSLSTNEIPSHNHTGVASSATADQSAPGGNLLAKTGDNTYGASASTTLDSGSLTHTGSGQGHENMQPWLAVYFCIALSGLFPSRN